jgi:hypothetical protein
MSTPSDPGQNAGDGNTPQDPSDPQNPYAPPPAAPPPPPDPTIDPLGPAAPQTPPPAAPPPPSYPPPATPIPPAPSPYGTAPPPPYGDPSATQAAPAYGGPPVAPASPLPGQPYVPPTLGTEEPGKGMAITSLILAILGCTCVTLVIAVPLAIVVLVRGRDGRNHGTGMAIAALVISALYVIGGAIGGYAVYSYAKDLKNVNDLRAGDCITAKGLTDKKAESVTEIRAVSCSGGHDGEVLAMVTLTKDQAANYDTTPFMEICDPAIQAAGKSGVLSDTVTYTALTGANPKGGDKAACVAYHADGSKLTGRLGG